MTNATRPKRVWGTVSAALSYEAKQLFRDSGWWTSVVLIASCVSIACVTGGLRTLERGTAIAAAKQDETKRISHLLKQLQQIERGEIKEPDAPFRDPRNAMYVGRGAGATVAYLPDSSLSFITAGVSSLYPPAIKVSAASRESFLLADELDNPLRLQSGDFDFAFFLAVVYPLFLIAISYDLISSERERGTLSMIRSTSVPPSLIFLCKLLIRCGSLAGWTMLTVGIYSLCLRDLLVSTEGWTHFLWLLVVIVVYTWFLSGGIFFLNCFGFNSTWNAMALVLAWFCLVVLWPMLATSVAETLFPAPSRFELLSAARAAAIETEQEEKERADTYQEERPRVNAELDERTRRTLLVTLASSQRVNRVLNDHQERLQTQRGCIHWLAYLGPSMLVGESVATLSGNDHARWDGFVHRVGHFHEKWQAFFTDRSARNLPLRPSDYEQFPRFDASEGELRPGEGVLESVPRMVWMCLATAAMLLSGCRRIEMES